MNKKGTRALSSVIALGVILTTLQSGNVKAAPGYVNKIPGKDRYETSSNVATANWKQGAENVIIASGEGYADSLSAALLAKKLNAPIILTKPQDLNTSAKEALKTLKAKNIYVIGGKGSVSQPIRDGLKKEGYSLTELGGKNRFETNLSIANYLVEKLNVKADEVLVVNGKDGFSDALSAAPIAAAKGQILLIVGKELSTTDLATKFIEKHNYSKITVIGTEGVVPITVYDKLGAKERVKGGKNRFETNLNIMNHFKLNTDKLYVANATGEGYADALVASTLAGKTGCQLILTDTKNSEDTKKAIEHIKSVKNNKTEATLVGGDSVIPEELLNQIKEAIKPEKIEKPTEPENPNNPEKPIDKHNFQIVWSFADVDEDLDVNTTNGKDDAKHDYVYIKFNKPISVAGDTKNLLNTLNYKLNKKSLPKGTEIKPNIKGLDDEDKVNDSITIILPNEYLKGKNEPHLITISSSLESEINGDVLANGGDKTLTWSVNGREIFNSLFGVEKQIYIAEVKSKKDLTLEDNLINSEKELYTANASIKSLDNNVVGKSSLEKRVNDVEKTIKDARIKFDESKDFEFSHGKITKYIGNKTDIVIPDTIRGEKVTIIGSGAFRNKNLTKIYIPEGVTTIKGLAFNNNKLKTLTIPDSVTELGNGAFTLNDIEDLKLSKGLKTIPVAFGYNNLVKVTIPEGVTRIENMAFSDNKLSEVTLPSTLIYLSGFNNNNFKSITIPKNVKELGKKAFARNKISSVTIPGNVKKIGESAFQNTWHDTFLTSIVIEEGVEKIDKYAFSLNHLKDINIPSSVKELASNAFHKNLGYDGVVHLFTPDYKNPNKFQESEYQIINPAKLTIKYVFGEKLLKGEEIWKISKKEGEEKYLHIGDKDIEITPKYEDNEYELEDKDLVKIDLNNKENELIIKCKKKDLTEKLTIKSIGKVAPVVVDLGTEQNLVLDKLSKDTYIVDSNGKNYQVELDWTINNYKGNISGEYTATATFKLPQGVFQSEPETKLEVIARIIVKENFGDIQHSEWEIKDFNFEGTTLSGFSDKGEEKLKNNKDLVLPKVNDKGETIVNIKNYSFANKELNSLVIPEGLNGLVIGTNAFENNKINKVYIPEGVKEIDAYAFSKNKLKYVDFPGTLKKIGNHAFADNELVSSNFSEETNMIAIDRFSFANNKITSITLLNDVKKVNGEAFTGNQSFNSDGKVHIFTTSFDPNNCNQWFPDSKYHKIIPLNK